MNGKVRVRFRNLVSGVIYEHTIDADLHPTGNHLSYKGFKELAKQIGKLVSLEIEDGLYWEHTKYTLDDFRWGAVVIDKPKLVYNIEEQEMCVLTAMQKAWKSFINEEV